MKKVVLSLIVLIGIAFNTVAKNTLPVPENNETRYDIIVVEGHHYLVVVSRTAQRINDGYHESTVSSAISTQVLHSFGCPCMNDRNHSNTNTTFDVVKFMND